MDGEVRYCTTEDGVRLAYMVIGSGRPLVFMIPIPGNIELETQLADVRAFYDALAPGHSIVRFDVRGTGASQRDVTDLSTEARVRDVASLVDHLGLDTFDVFAGPGVEAHTAIVYCAEHPRRVRRLVLWEPVVATHPPGGPVFEARRLLILDDWRGATSVIAREFSRRRPDAEQRIMRQLYRETISPELFVAWWDVTGDVSQLLPAVRVPTLVLHARKDQQFSIDEARVVAALMPDARLSAIDADNAYFFAWHEQIVPRVREFLGDSPVTGPPASASGPFRTVLFTDLVGHTEMMRRLGDDRGREVLREHERITRDLLRQHGGQEVKTMGDGFMASFASVTKAVDCAIALQQAFARPPASDLQHPIEIRVGLNAGEPIEEDGDLFGSTVIMASRICAQAGPGEILIPEPLRHLLSGKSYVYADRGDVVLKGFEDPVRLYEVRWSS